MGCAAAIVFTVIGSAYGTAKSSGAIFATGITRPDRLMQNAFVSSPHISFILGLIMANHNHATRGIRSISICAIMAQIVSIYGLVIGVIISGDLSSKMHVHQGFLQLGAGISVGLCGLAAGFAIGIVGDAGGESSDLSWSCVTVGFRWACSC